VLTRRASFFLALLVFLASAAGWPSPAVEDFTFIQVSDCHAPMEQSRNTIQQLRNVGEILMEPYGVTAKAPSFVIATGDLTEFGAGAGTWEKYLSYWEGVDLPVYQVAGNHDNTWDSIRYHLRAMGKSPYFSFDAHGCHFIGLDSATVQDPRPSFGQEQIEFVRKDLAKVAKDTPIFVFFHHPMDTNEFASDYDKDRLLDLFEGHNLALLLVGHGHAARTIKYASVDDVMGGSTYQHAPTFDQGYNVISVKDGVLRVAYKAAKDEAAKKPLLEKPLFAETPPVITIASPQERWTYPGRIPIRAWIRLADGGAEKADYDIDGKIKGALELQPGGSFQADVDLSSLPPGAHYLKIIFTGPKAVFQKSTFFYTTRGAAKVLWRARMGGEAKGAAAISGNTVYAGGGDGVLYAFDAGRGTPRWQFSTGGEILTEPLVVGDTVYFGSGDGKLYALTTSGQLRWSFTAGDAIYSSPVFADGLVLFGCNDSTFYAVRADTGELAWRFDEPEYTIESKPFVSDGVVYFGAWDRYVYAVNVKDGTLKWKCMGKGSAEQKAAKYFSPADCGPIVSGSVLMVADRNYDLSIIDVGKGERVGSVSKCSAVGLSEDGRSTYLRRTGGDLTKIDLSGKEIWSVPAGLGYLPAAPREKDGVVYVASGVGLVQAFSAADGRKLWEYQATPQLYVFSEVAVSGAVAYVTGMDGTLTALGGRN